MHWVVNPKKVVYYNVDFRVMRCYRPNFLPTIMKVNVLIDLKV